VRRHRKHPKLTSVYPDLRDGKVVRLAACAVCGSVQVFRDEERDRFPDTGLWTECRACGEWQYFYALGLLASVINKNKGYELR
jgi:hypothetical protein